MHTYQIDISPYAQVEEGIQRTENKDGVPEGYKSYKYTSFEDDSFDLSTILCGGKALNGIVSSMVNVEEIITYFKGIDKRLLVIHFSSELANFYYFNQDTTENIENTIFTEFSHQEEDVFGTKDLEKILSNIEENKGFDLVKLSGRHHEFAGSIFHSSYLIFDISIINGPYVSELSDKKLTVKKTDIGKYKKIHHDYEDSFHVKGIKLSNGNHMRVKGGFPDDSIDEFIVYYKEDDSEYKDPLMLTLKIDNHKELCAHSYYLLSKNGSNGKWDIRKICSVIDEKTELVQVLQNIATNNRLLVDRIIGEELKSKLGDIRGGLTIDLTHTKGDPGSINYYDSEGIRIPYKKKIEKEKHYVIVLHAYIYSFSIKKIKLPKNKELTEDDLPPCGTLFGQLKVYYPDQKYKEIVFIELECSHELAVDESPICVYYYSKDYQGKWVAYRLDTNVSLTNARFGDFEKDLVVYHIRENHGYINPSKFQNIEKLGGAFNKCLKNGGIARRNKPKNSATKGNKDDEDVEDSNRSQVIGYVLASLASVMTIGIGAYLIWPSMRRHIYSSFI